MSKANQKKHPVLENVNLGVGTWSWGDRLCWGYGKGYQDEDLRSVFNSSLESGVNFFDSAEVYGQGRSERLLGKFIKNAKQEVKVATKFMPFPWRIKRSSLLNALRKSLERLDLSSVDLYQIHMPLPPVSIKTWVEALGEAQQAGLTSAVGVSNFNRNQVQIAYDTLIRQGIKLASNQVEYSLLNRDIENNGLLKLCKELEITIIAYSPLAMGILTGKYSPDNPPPGMRSRRYNCKYLNKIQPLIIELRKIGADHGGKTPSQVALNWVICKGAVPIPGAKNQKQALQNSETLRWRITPNEIAVLEETSERVLKWK